MPIIVNVHFGLEDYKFLKWWYDECINEIKNFQIAELIKISKYKNPTASHVQTWWRIGFVWSYSNEKVLEFDVSSFKIPLFCVNIERRTSLFSIRKWKLRVDKLSTTNSIQIMMKNDQIGWISGEEGHGLKDVNISW